MIPPLRLVLQPSSRLAVCLGGLHLAALLAAVNSFGGWPLLLVLTGTALSAVVTLGMALLRLPGAIVEIELQEDYSARWRDSTGCWHAGRLAQEGYVGAGLVLMALDGAHDSRRHWVALGWDSAPRDSLRTLRRVMRSRQDSQEMPHNHDAG